jgi:competence protein ComEA
MVELERAEPQVARFEVDINSADWPELAQLPTIGETLARRIVESRQKGGPFRDHEDLRRVHGIGPRTLEAIRPYLRPVKGKG